MEGLCAEYDKKLGYVGSMTIMVLQHRASMAAHTGDMDTSLKLAVEAYTACQQYFEGNELNEIFIDPLIIQASALMHKGDFPKALALMTKAESITKAI